MLPMPGWVVNQQDQISQTVLAVTPILLLSLHTWGVLGQRLSIDTPYGPYVDDPGEIFECYCSAAVSLIGLLSLSQKDGEPEGHDDLNRHI